MTIVDWRQVDARALALVFARERARWVVELGWETRDTWLQVERARTSWGLPGLAAVDDGGRVRGLTFFHQVGSRFELGGVFAESPAVRESLLDAAIGVCADAGGDELGAFVYSNGSVAPEALRRRGFTVELFDYLSLPLEKLEPRAVSDDAGIVIREWRPSDATEVATLLHRSYSPEAARRLVPDGTEQGWRHYLDTMIAHATCGQVLPGCSRVALVSDALAGVALVTALGPGTAHIAQVAVHPDWRRRKLAGRLIDEAAHLARREGYGRVTLLAASRNIAAQALYRARGYQALATFSAAVMPLPSALTAQAS